MQTVAESKTGIIDKCLQLLFPHWAREQKKIVERSARIELTIQSYSELSQQVQTEIDNNHFAPFLHYEKVNR